MGERAANVREPEQQHQRRGDTERDIDQEHPAPAGAVGDKAAQGWAEDAREAEHGAEDARDTASLFGREQVGDGGEGHRLGAAGAEALDAAKHDQVGHCLRPAAQQAADQKDDDAAQQEQLAAVQVAQLAEDGHAGGAGQQVGGGHPGVAVEALQLGHDARHGRADDGLVERREQHRRHHARQRRDQLRPR